MNSATGRGGRDYTIKGGRTRTIQDQGTGADADGIGDRHESVARNGEIRIAQRDRCPGKRKITRAEKSQRKIRRRGNDWEITSDRQSAAIGLESGPRIREAGQGDAIVTGNVDQS